MRCEWARAGEPACTHKATVILQPKRPCGHVEGRAPTCPGHAEALVGEAAPVLTPCPACGQVNSPTPHAADVMVLT